MRFFLPRIRKAEKALWSQLAANTPPDIVLLDLDMPRIDLELPESSRLELAAEANHRKGCRRAPK